MESYINKKARDLEIGDEFRLGRSGRFWRVTQNLFLDTSGTQYVKYEAPGEKSEHINLGPDLMVQVQSPTEVEPEPEPHWYSPSLPSKTLYDAFVCDGDGHADLEIQAHDEGPLSGRDDLAAQRLVMDLEDGPNTQIADRNYAIEKVMTLLFGSSYQMHEAPYAVTNKSPFWELMDAVRSLWAASDLGDYSLEEAVKVRRESIDRIVRVADAFELLEI